MAQQRAHLGAEHELTLRETPIKRLLAETVAHQVNRTGSSLAKGKGEHAVDPRYSAADTVSADQLKQDFGIRAIAQHHTRATQFVGERGIAVDLSIED